MCSLRYTALSHARVAGFVRFFPSHRTVGIGYTEHFGSYTELDALDHQLPFIVCAEVDEHMVEFAELLDGAGAPSPVLLNVTLEENPWRPLFESQLYLAYFRLLGVALIGISIYAAYVLHLTRSAALKRRAGGNKKSFGLAFVPLMVM